MDPAADAANVAITALANQSAVIVRPGGLPSYTVSGIFEASPAEALDVRGSTLVFAVLTASLSDVREISLLEIGGEQFRCGEVPPDDAGVTRLTLERCGR